MDPETFSQYIKFKRWPAGTPVLTSDGAKVNRIDENGGIVLAIGGWNDRHTKFSKVCNGKKCLLLT